MTRMSSGSSGSRSFPDRNPTPVLEVDPSGEVLYANPAARADFPDLEASGSHPVRRGLPELYERLRRERGRARQREVTVGDAVYEQYISLSEDKSSLQVYLFERTTTSEQQPRTRSVQAFFEEVLDELPTEVAVLDPEGRYLYINPAAVGDPEVREWLIGRTTVDYARYRDLDPEPFRERHEWIRSIAESQETGRMMETLETSDGEDRHILRIVHPVVGEDGEVRRLLGYGLDLTERKRFEDELREAKERAERASSVKTAMLANMSHEVRTPLTSIIGFASMIADGTADNAPEFAELIERSGQRLMQTLDAVLDLSRLEAGEDVLERRPMDLGEHVRETIDLLRPQAERAELEMDVRYPDQSLWVDADPDAVNRVVTNLVSNAIKFTEEGGVEVRLRAEEDRAVLAVEDTGVGIRDEFLDDLFEAFRQESSGLGRTYEGVGLGLKIVRELVDRMDGSIDVESEKGTGSCFTVRIPRSDRRPDGK